MTTSQKRILLIEDSPDIQMLMTKLLESSGYSVTRANNGKLGLKMLESASVFPHLILLDLMMPEMDGYQFREEQKKNIKFSSIPVIIMSADEDVQTIAKQIDAQSFLKKPFRNMQVVLDGVGNFF